MTDCTIPDVARFAGLEDLDPARPGAEAFGGKALGLARLIRLGLPVPPGFAMAATCDRPDTWPDAMLAEFRERAMRLLAQGTVAVRSSAIGEDGATRSFAGQFHSVLEAGTLEQVLEAATRCIASGAGERVLAYAGTEQPLAVGLVVQRMVKPRAAGVLFTCDPTGHDPGLAIEAVAGLGEALVAGRAEPERWRVYRTGTGQVEAQVDPRQGGPVLDSRMARELALTAWNIAVKLASDLDLEWAIAQDGSVFWLQARPVTAHIRWRPPVISRSVPEAEDGPITVWGNWNVRENMPDPLTPLNWSIWRDTVVPVVTRGLFGLRPSAAAFRHAHPVDLVDGRVYFNMNALLAAWPLGKMLPKMLDIIDARAGETTRSLLAKGVIAPRKLPPTTLGDRLATIVSAVRANRDATLPFRPRAALAALAEAGDRIAARPPVALLNDAELLRELHLFNSPDMGVLVDGLGMANIGFFVGAAAQRLFRPWPEAARLLSAGFTGNPNTEISLAVDALIDAAVPIADRFATAESPPGGGAGERTLESLRQAGAADLAVTRWLARLGEFLARFGHRAPFEAEMSNPRWSEDPGMIVDLVACGLRNPDRQRLPARLAQLSAERGCRIGEAVAQAGFPKRLLMRWLAHATLLYSPLRDAPKHQAMKAIFRVRQAALETGRRLEDRQLLANRDDVFFLEFEELVTLLGLPGGTPVEGDTRALVARRKAEYLAVASRRAPDFIRSDGVPVPDASALDPATPGVLRGVGIGTGKGAGAAAILLEPRPDQLAPGSVLVVEFADPGWTPLFPLASAIVMEVGGAMCHAAVVARELGIPAVFGVRGATRLIRAGAMLDVDGDDGTVTVRETT